ncbi:hypothetical protein HanHA300_Chr09g0338721 [Helianthus annuus]|nr:hypothetical protein HanHA300_Chr09g0338721 [Helianthus annuus]KAJ0544295.1 hypothetical protein HanHA89_Chr09g0360031 [Helianthus annuus]
MNKSSYITIHTLNSQVESNSNNILVFVFSCILVKFSTLSMFSSLLTQMFAVTRVTLLRVIKEHKVSIASSS